MNSALAHLCTSAFVDKWILCAFLYPAQCTYCAPPQWMRALTLANVVHSRAHLSLWKSASFVLSLSIPPFFTPFLSSLLTAKLSGAPGTRAKIDILVSKLLSFGLLPIFWRFRFPRIWSWKSLDFGFGKFGLEKSLGFGKFGLGKNSLFRFRRI